MSGDASTPAGALSLLVTRRTLQIARGGRLQRWLGPALRGLAGGRLRARVCRHGVVDQLGRWARCAGCPHLRGCAYGETFEPDPPAGVRLPGGWENAARPLVIAPEYPCPPVAQAGDRIDVTVTFAGPVAAAHAANFWDALRVGGADPLLGLGEDQVLFDVLPPAEPDRSEPVQLSADPAAMSGELPRVRVVLTSPLVLNANDGNGRRLTTSPTLADLVRAGLRVFGPLFRCYGVPLPEPVFAQVKALAAPVPTLRAEFALVEQVKSSHRSGDRWPVRGIIGWGEYGPLPAGLLPWLRWAGRVHAGTHRVAGAGGWRVEESSPLAPREECDAGGAPV